MATSDSLKRSTESFRFLVEQLPPAKRELFDQCNNATSLLFGIESLDLIKYHDVNTKRIKWFVELLQPFSSAMDVLCQLDPIHFATVWGGLRVIIQVCAPLGTCHVGGNYGADRSSLLTTLRDSLTSSWRVWIDCPLRCPSSRKSRTNAWSQAPTDSGVYWRMSSRISCSI